jgi:2-polyprenyl-3-methyl-5-hydroxy-6-metoxy-1,4-benzoquinol methylase
MQEPTAMQVWHHACSGGKFQQAILALLQHVQLYPDQAADVFALIGRAHFNLDHRFRHLFYALKSLWYDSHNLDGIHELASAIRSLTFWHNPLATFLEHRRIALERQQGMLPPTTIHDRAGWEAFWRYRIAHRYIWGLLPHPELAPVLVDLLYERGMRTVLCVGNGICQEPRLLAMAGFRVIAVDLSETATQFAVAFDMGDDDSVLLGKGLRPHPGGSVQFLTGDLFALQILPYTFDAIITRRTLQHVSDTELDLAVTQLLARLTPTGILINHAHNAYDSIVKLHRVLQSHGVVVVDLRIDGEGDVDVEIGTKQIAWSINSSGVG